MNLDPRTRRAIFSVPTVRVDHVTRSNQRRALAALISTLGIMSAWFSAEPAGLLLVVGAMSICFGWQKGFAAVVVTAAIGAALLQPPIYGGDDGSLRWLVYTSCAFGMWGLVAAFRTVAFYDQVYQTAQPTIEDIPGLGWSAYPDGRMRFVNPAATDFVGISSGEMKEIMHADVDSWWRKFVHPDDVERCLAKWKHSLKTGEPLVDEQRVLQADGSYRWLRDSAVAARDAKGNITAWYGTTVDIDDQRKAEEALRLSRLQLQLLIDTVPALVWRTDRDGKRSYINRQLAEWFGLGDMEARAVESTEFRTTIIDRVHEADKTTIEHILSTSFQFADPFSFKCRQQRFDGAYRWVSAKVEPLHDDTGEIVQWYGVFLDIHDEIEAHEAVLRSERQMRLLVDTVPSLIWLLRPDGMPYYFNKRFVDWSGVEQGDPVYGAPLLTSPEDLIHPDDRARADEKFQKHLASGEPLHIKGRLRRKDGAYRWVDSRVEPLRDENGNIVRWYGVSFEIEDEVRAQVALKESQSYLQHMIDTVPVGILLSNPNGQPVYANKRVLIANGLIPLPSDGLGNSAEIQATQSLIHTDDRDEVFRKLEQFHRDGQPYSIRYRQRRADGAYRWIEHRSEPFMDEAGDIVQWYGVYLDVDDEVKAQEALRLADERLARASRAASLSELSVSIAHELNQPLQAMVSNANAFQRWLRRDPPNYERASRSAEWIVRDADAAAEVIMRIRSLFSQTKLPKKPLSINDIVEDVCNLLADRLSANEIRLRTNLDEQLPDTVADRVQIEQVILNVMRNAVEAMEDSPTTLRVLNVQTSLAPESMIEIRVIDTGPGIDDPERVFDAFFTTKKDGMGIGLAICRSIAEAHGGYMRVSNSPEGGACVVFGLHVRAGLAETTSP